MNETYFMNSYVKLLNESFNEAINKNIVLRAQLEVATQSNSELLTKYKDILEKYNALKESPELEKNFSDDKENENIPTFKRELLNARNSLKKALDENGRLKKTLHEKQNFKEESLSENNS